MWPLRSHVLFERSTEFPLQKENAVSFFLWMTLHVQISPTMAKGDRMK